MAPYALTPNIPARGCTQAGSKACSSHNNTAGNDNGSPGIHHAAGNVKANTDDYRTSLDKVFAAGDIRKGQSLVVWAIREGRQAASAIDEYLMGETELPR